MQTFPMTIVYDFHLKKVGCALIQVSHGGSIDGFSLQRFGTENWLTAPTETMGRYTLYNEEELEKAITLTLDSNPKI